MSMVRELESAYAAEGRAALESMGGMKAYVLYEEKCMALAGAEKMLAEQSEHDRRILRRDKLKEEVDDIVGWFKEKELGMKRTVLEKLQEASNALKPSQLRPKTKDQELER
jgi:hypothetical protein